MSTDKTTTESTAPETTTTATAVPPPRRPRVLGQQTRVLKIALRAEAVAFVAFAILAGALLRAGNLALGDVSKPGAVLAAAGAHPAVDPILYGMALAYLVIGIGAGATSIYLWSAIFEDAPWAGFLLDVVGKLAGGLFLVTALVGVARSTGGNITLFGADLSPRDLLALLIFLPNVASLLYGIAVAALSHGAKASRTLPAPLIALGYVWALVAILSVPVVLLGVLTPPIGAVWCWWLSRHVAQYDPDALLLAAAAPPTAAAASE